MAEYRRALFLGPNNASLELELGIAFALRAQNEHRTLDFEFAMEHFLKAELRKKTPEANFDLALLYLEVPMFLQGRQRWEFVATNDPSSKWRKEAQEHLDKLNAFLTGRERRLREITASPSYYSAHSNESADSLEVVTSEALEYWIRKLYDSEHVRTALITLASSIESKHHDPWLLDLLKLRDSGDARAAFENLSKSVAANINGEHKLAFELASAAEGLFRKFNNHSGILRSRIEVAYALHRRFQAAEECLSISRHVRQQAHQRHYRWIEDQAWLEEISCSAYAGESHKIRERENAFKQITETGYTVLGLRALNFLIDPYASFGSRLKIWERGHDGLEHFWNSLSPGVRAEQFYFKMALSARNAGKQQTALALLREGALTIQEAQDRQLRAVLLADLGAWQSEEGFPQQALSTFAEMEKIFEQLNQTEIGDFRHETEIVRAQAEIASGHSREAVVRLRHLTDGMKFPYLELAANVRTRLLPSFGDALLASGNLNEALKYYQEATHQYHSDSIASKNSDQRENAQHLESAWRGLTNVELRLGKKQEALITWEQFRSSHSTAVMESQFKPPAGFAFLTYAFLPQGLSAWLLNSQGIEQKWIDSQNIVIDAEQFSRLAADPDHPDSTLSALSRSARRLYTALLEPFKPHLPTNGVLIIDADGPLAGIPWSALEDKDGHALIERFGVAQVSGWADAMPAFSHTGINVERPLIMADPTLGRELWDQYPPLFDARAEAQWLHARMERTAQYIPGREATLPALLQYLPSSTLFHFAGHGVSYGGFGALLLAPSGTDRTSTHLATAGEIAGMNLSQLDLAVLAACSSGEGEQSGVVSVDSLVSAFLQAKARTVIASRWQASSEPTAHLMRLFYEGIISGQMPAVALKNAELTIRKDSSTSHPFFWASFQVFGTP